MRPFALRLAPLVLVALVGCSEHGPGALSLVAMDPDRGLQGVAVRVSIEGTFTGQVVTDFQATGQSRFAAAFGARLGGVSLLEVSLQPDGRLGATVPESLEPGLYPLTVVDPAGREQRLEAAYQVLSAGVAETPVASLRFDPLGPQAALVPFPLSIEALDAEGARVTSFNGQVALTDLTGTAVPGTLGSFVDGQWSGLVEIRRAHASDVLTARSPDGATGSSNAFAVAPLPAIALHFATPPHSVVAGTCSPPVGVELIDELGDPAAAASPLALRISASQPVGFVLYGDPGCTQPAAAETPLPAGDQRASFYFRGTRSGVVSLTASSASLHPQTQVETVTPAEAQSAVFLTAPQSHNAGACSDEVRLQARDAFANPAPLAAAGGAAALSAAPAAGFAFFSDPGCASPITQLAAPLGATDWSFYFRGTVPGQVVVTAELSGLAPVSQAEQVVPLGAATGFVFVSAQQTVMVGNCSGAVRLETRDSAGNTFPPAGAVQVELAATPSARFGFFADAACTTGVSSLPLALGASSVPFYFLGEASGPVSVAASAIGLNGATQLQTLTPGPTTVLAFDPIGSPRVLGVPFEVTVRALDAFGNHTPDFGGLATLSLDSKGTVTCTRSCAGTTLTSPFLRGTWTGRVAAGFPAAGTRALVAWSGTVSGTSNPFDVTALAEEAPPTARFTMVPPVVLVGQQVAFDASASTDLASAAGSLEVSWDFSGSAPGGPPWTPWKAAHTAVRTFTAAGTLHPRLAVRNASGAVGYATGTLVVLPDPGTRCTVDTSSAADDGAVSCAGPFGADGKLSLPEAVRLSNSAAGKQTLTFSGPMAFSSGPALSFSGPVDVLVPPGVVLDAPLQVSSGTAFISGLELAGVSHGPLRLEPHASLILVDSSLHDFAGVLARGNLTLERVELTRCAGTCVEVDHPQGSATVRFSAFEDGAGTGVLLSSCPLGIGVDVASSTFAGMATGIAASCRGPMTIRHNTFDSNQTGVSYLGGSGQLLQANVFTNNAATAVSCGTASFTGQDDNLLHLNVSDGCVAGGAGTLLLDPLFVFAAGGDFRLLPSSPAVDSAGDLGLDTNGPGPGSFFGAGPDRGGAESH